MARRAADGDDISKSFASLFRAHPADFAGAVEPGSFQQRLARRKFLKAIERYVPAFLATVQREVFPPFAAAIRTLEAFGAAPMKWLEIDRRFRLPESASFSVVRAAVLHCAVRFNLVLRDSDKGAVLPAAWACDVVALTVSSWHRNPRLTAPVPRFPFDEDFPYGDWIERVQGRRYTLDLAVRGPNPHESYGEFEGRMLAAVKSHLRRDWEAAHGGDKRATPEKVQDQHFAWLALFQVAGISYGQIADGLHFSTHDVIRKAMQSTAAALPLTLRAARPGRPRKTRTSSKAGQGRGKHNGKLLEGRRGRRGTRRVPIHASKMALPQQRAAVLEGRGDAWRVGRLDAQKKDKSAHLPQRPEFRQIFGIGSMMISTASSATTAQTSGEALKGTCAISSGKVSEPVWMTSLTVAVPSFTSTAIWSRSATKRCERQTIGARSWRT